MKIETLKTLVKQIKLETQDIDQAEGFMINKFLELLDLYESDNSNELSDFIKEQPKSIFKHYPSPYDKIGIIQSEEKVPYHTLCGCNPDKGGSGICNCVMANELVSTDIRKDGY